MAQRVKVLGAGSSDDEDDDPDQKNNIVFNATSEFCRTLGDIPTYGLSGNREDQEAIMVGTKCRAGKLKSTVNLSTDWHAGTEDPHSEHFIHCFFFLLTHLL